MLKSTKLFDRMPCAHAQYFDQNEDGTQGPCAGLHGYSRSVKMEFSGTADEHGWLVPFGKLKEVRKWLQFYFDHTAVIPADDPRLDTYRKMSEDGLIVLRVLPYGVSMEMSALFVYEHVNPYIHLITDGRCVLTRVECIENEANSALVETSLDISIRNAQSYHIYGGITKTSYLEEHKEYPFTSPVNKIKELLC